MSEITTPATVRTDLRGPDGRSARTVDPAPAPPRIRGAGLLLAVTAPVFAVTMAFGGPEASEAVGRLVDATGFVFQLGLFALLTVMLRTHATGTGRAGRGLLLVEYALLGVASVWSVLHAAVPRSVQEATWMTVLDLFWPVSMLGMAIVGITVAAAGVWRGALRWWTAAGCAWVLAAIPVSGLLPGTAGMLVGTAYMIVGFGGIGLLLALRPELTRR